MNEWSITVEEIEADMRRFWEELTGARPYTPGPEPYGISWPPTPEKIKEFKRSTYAVLVLGQPQE